MGTNTITARATGNSVAAADPNMYRTALLGDLVPRNAITGAPADDAGALGSATTSWSDLFLASGGIINFNNGNYTITHSPGLLAFHGVITNDNYIAGTDANGYLQLFGDPSSSSGLRLTDAALLTLQGTGSILSIAGTTASTSSTTGALVVSGGAGFAGAINAGAASKITGTLTLENTGVAYILKQTGTYATQWNLEVNWGSTDRHFFIRNVTDNARYFQIDQNTGQIHMKTGMTIAYDL